MCNYKMPSSWYEQDVDLPYECYKCEEKEKILQIAQDYLVKIREMLYGDKNFDNAQLDDVFGELCHQLDVQVPAHLPNLIRKDAINSWVEFNNTYLKEQKYFA